jgi:ABC-2 type transport system ATP-binding protein
MEQLLIKDLKKAYDDIKALRGISFGLEKGEIFGLIGPDGAGKTTLIRIIVSLLNQDEGVVFFQEKNVRENISFVRANIGYMPQRFSLYPDLTVEQNLRFFGDLFGVSIQQQEEKLRRLYKFSRLEPFAKREAGALSGGMKQKLALCCALIHEPQILVLDEPTVGVDPVSRNEFWQILHELAEQGTTILISTAYMDEAAQCDRIGLIHEGNLLAVAKPEVLVRDFKFPIYHLKTDFPYATYEILKNSEFGCCIQLFGSGVHLLDRNNYGETAINSKLRALGIEIKELHKTKPQLEDIFLELLNGTEKNS